MRAVVARKKLIEVALPLDAVNRESALRKRKAPSGYPTTLHKWWAQRPLAAARAVIFAQMVDDPSSDPQRFPTEETQETERQRLFKLIQDLVLWENSGNARLLAQAREEIHRSWRGTCAQNQLDPRVKELFDPNKLPVFHDPFAGGGSLPLEAQRLGMETYASDLNPVAVLINKAMIEIPPRFAGCPPVNPETRNDERLFQKTWSGARGMADDVRYYGKWMRDEALKRIGHLYPNVEITEAMASGRPELSPLVGRKLQVIGWLWARTVRCPNPACSKEMPLLSSFVLSTSAGRKKYLVPITNEESLRFRVSDEIPQISASPNSGYKRGISGIFECAFCGTVTSRDYVATQATEHGLGAVQTAVIAAGNRTRVYLDSSATAPVLLPEPEDIAGLDIELSPNPRDVWCRNFGLHTPKDLFTPRQLLAMLTFSDLVGEARKQVMTDASNGRLCDDARSLDSGGQGAAAYAEAVAVYLAMAVSRLADYGSSLATWRPKDNAMRSSLAKQTLPMTWDFAEGSPFGESSSGFPECAEVVAKVLEELPGAQQGTAFQKSASATAASTGQMAIISTDPPYFDNISYADLSDFFYVWLRRSLKTTYPSLFATVTVPKAEELVATSYRHGSTDKAESFFLTGMTGALTRLFEEAHPAFPITIYYAFKQSESDDKSGTVSTGWDTFLGAVIAAGFTITGTWPMRTEGDNRQIGVGTNALASSIVLVCRPRMADAPTATRREFLAALKTELPVALSHLQRGNIAPVDLAQAAIGPGMAVYTRYAKVLDSEGKPLSVREALALINRTLDETLAEQEGDFDADSRWAVAWFDQSGFDDGDYGLAETLSKAKNTSISGMLSAHILASKSGRVRLLRPDELPVNWDPEADLRLTAWESVHQLVRVLEAGGEAAAAELVAKLGSNAEIARELAYRLYTVCERKKRALEALSYNGLVQSWPEIMRLARQGVTSRQSQTEMFD
jgi:putative DNA methylase